MVLNYSVNTKKKILPKKTSKKYTNKVVIRKVKIYYSSGISQSLKTDHNTSSQCLEKERMYIYAHN